MDKLKKELGRFFIAGCSAVATDLTVYYLLLSYFSHSPAKTISFLSGTIVAYLINKYWTFEKQAKSLREALSFLGLYLFTLLVNVSVNKFSLGIFPNFTLLAFLLATGCSTVLNFLGQKYLVFK